MDHLQLQLTGGPQGYRVHLKNMEIYGASNFTVETLKLSENGKPFEARIAIPKLNIKAKYSSTGVLIIIPASGSGDFSAIFDGVVASVRGTVRLDEREAGTFMQVDTLDLDLIVKKVRMHVSKIFNNSKLLSEYSLLDKGEVATPPKTPKFNYLFLSSNSLLFFRRGNQSLPPREWK